MSQMGSDVQFLANLILFSLQNFHLITNLLDVLSALRFFGRYSLSYIYPATCNPRCDPNEFCNRPCAHKSEPMHHTLSIADGRFR